MVLESGSASVIDAGGVLKKVYHVASFSAVLQTQQLEFRQPSGYGFSFSVLSSFVARH